jgi:hypothetical protein
MAHTRSNFNLFTGLTNLLGRYDGLATCRVSDFFGADPLDPVDGQDESNLQRNTAAQHSTPWHSTARHGTASVKPARHSTAAQHGTAAAA